MKKRFEKNMKNDRNGNGRRERRKDRERDGFRDKKKESFRNANTEEEQVKSISENMYDFTGETEKQSYIYGRNAVAELLKSGQTINKVWISKEARGNDLEKIIRELKEEKIVYIFVDKEKLDTIQENNQGIIASINPFEYVEIDEILKEKEIRNEASFILVLDKIEDTHNLGAIIRVAEAAGVHRNNNTKKKCSRCNTTYNKNISRSSKSYKNCKGYKYSTNTKRIERKRNVGCRNRLRNR